MLRNHPFFQSILPLVMLLFGPVMCAPVLAQNRVLILPYHNLSRDSTYNWFGEGLYGLTFYAIKGLSEYPMLERYDFERAKNSMDSNYHRESDSTIHELGERLFAQYILSAAYEIQKNKLIVKSRWYVPSALEADTLFIHVFPLKEKQNKIFSYIARYISDQLRYLKPDLPSAHHDRLIRRITPRVDTMEIFRNYGTAVFYYNEGWVSSARPWLEKIIPMDGRYSPALYILSEIYYGQPNYDQALLYADEIIRWDSTHSGAWLLKGKIHSTMHDHAEAAGAFRQALFYDSMNAEVYFETAKWYYERDRTDSALCRINRAIAMDSLNLVYYNYRGMIYRSAGHIDSAEMNYRRALDFDSTYGHAWYHLASVLSLQNRKEEALDAFQRSLKYFVDLDHIYFNTDLDSLRTSPVFQSLLLSEYQSRCIIERFIGLFMDYNVNAERYLRQAMELDSSASWIYSNLGDIYFLGNQYLTAHQYYQKALRFKPDSTYYYYKLAASFQQLNQKDSVYVYLDRYAALDSHKTETILKIGQLYSEMNEYDRLISFYRRYLDTLTQQRGAFCMDIAEAYFNQNKYYDALKYYQYVIDSDSALAAKAYYQKARCYQLMEWHEPALYCFFQAASHDSSYHRHYYFHENLRSVYQSLKNYKQALWHSLKAAEIDTTDGWAPLFAAGLYAKLGNRKKAMHWAGIGLAKDSNTAGLLNNAGYVFGTLKEYKTALMYYDNAIRLDSNDPIYHSNRGSILMKLKRYEEAYVALCKARSLDSNQSYIHYNFACYFSVTNQIEPALYYFQKAVNWHQWNIETFRKEKLFAAIRRDMRFKQIINNLKKAKTK